MKKKFGKITVLLVVLALMVGIVPLGISAQTDDVFVVDYEGTVVSTKDFASDSNVTATEEGVGEDGSKGLHTSLVYHESWSWNYGTKTKLTGDTNWPGRGEAKYLTFWYNTTEPITAKLILCDPDFVKDWTKTFDIPAGSGYYSVDISECTFASYRCPQLEIFGNNFSEDVKAIITDGATVHSYFDNFRYTKYDLSSKFLIDYEGTVVSTKVFANDANITETAEGVGEDGSKGVHTLMVYRESWSWNYGTKTRLSGDNNWPGRGEAKYLTFWYNTTHPVTAKIVFCDPDFVKDWSKTFDIPAGCGYYSVDISECTFASYRTPELEIFGNNFSEDVRAAIPEGTTIHSYFDNFRYTKDDVTSTIIVDYEGTVVSTKDFASDSNVTATEEGVGEDGSKGLHTSLVYHESWSWNYGTKTKLTGDTNWPGRGEAKYLTFWYNTTEPITAKLILCDPDFVKDWTKTFDIPAGSGYYSVDISECTFASYRCPQLEIFGNNFSEDVKAIITDGATVHSYFDNFRYTKERVSDDKCVLDLKASVGGSVTGSGTYDKNASVTAVATPDKFYKFVGWYEGDALVSSEATYTFNIAKSIDLKAKFEMDVEEGTKLEGEKINLFGEGTDLEVQINGEDSKYSIVDTSSEKGLGLNISFNYSSTTTYAHGLRVYLKANNNNVLIPITEENRYISFWADSKTAASMLFLACDPNWGTDKEYVINLKPGKHYYSIDLSDCGFASIRCPQFMVFDYDFTDEVMDQLTDGEEINITFDSFVMTSKDYSEADDSNKDDDNNTGNTGNVPQTGDNSHMAIYVVLMLVSALAIVLISKKHLKGNLSN